MSLRDQLLVADTDAERADAIDLYVRNELAGAISAAQWNPTNTALVDPVSGEDILTFDAYGNIMANVNLRTDTLENLLALSGGGGVSEIGSISDKRGIVLFNGVEGEARPVISHDAGMFLHRLPNTTTSATPSTEVAMDFDTILPPLINDFGWDSSTPSEVPVPSYAKAISISGGARFAASPAGTSNTIKLQYWNGSAWATAMSFSAQNPNGTDYVYINYNGTWWPASGDINKVRLVQSAAAASLQLINTIPLRLEMLVP